jgi:hypothetical protein
LHLLHVCRCCRTHGAHHRSNPSALPSAAQALGGMAASKSGCFLAQRSCHCRAPLIWLHTILSVFELRCLLTGSDRAGFACAAHCLPQIVRLLGRVRGLLSLLAAGWALNRSWEHFRHAGTPNSLMLVH